MTGNTNLNATSDAVGTTTVANLLTWGETRKGQIETATTDYDTALYAARTKWITECHTPGTFHENNSATDSYWVGLNLERLRSKSLLKIIFNVSKL